MTPTLSLRGLHNAKETELSAPPPMAGCDFMCVVGLGRQTWLCGESPEAVVRTPHVAGCFGVDNCQEVSLQPRQLFRPKCELE